jgi:hypothetical protein
LSVAPFAGSIAGEAGYAEEHPDVDYYGCGSTRAPQEGQSPETLRTASVHAGIFQLLFFDVKIFISRYFFGA